MTKTIAAVVVSLYERRTLLHEALDSIYNQTRPPDDVVIGLDPRRLGEVENMNRLMHATDCDWVAFLHDDDLWYEDHLAVAEPMMDNFDVLVAGFRSVGRPQDTFPPYHEHGHPRPFEQLRITNWFAPSMVLANRKAFGRWCHPNQRFGWVDWVNWNRLIDEGARFAYTGATTVDYRFGDWGNGSWHG